MKIIKLIGAFLFCSQVLSAQTCTTTFEAQAGPDIDVCAGGSVGLQGSIGGGATRGVWRGGRGSFNPDRNTLEVEYTPAESETDSTVILILVADNPKTPSCPKVRDEIRITVNNQPKAEAGENLSSCGLQPVKLHGTVKEGRAKKVEWISNGAGKIENADKLDAEFVPAPGDLAKGGCSVQLIVYPYGVCLPDSDAVAIILKPMPEVTFESEFISGKPEQPIGVPAIVKGDPDKISWTTSGTGKFEKGNTPTPTYIPSKADGVKGRVELTIHASLKDSPCVEVKKITLILPKN